MPTRVRNRSPGKPASTSLPSSPTQTPPMMKASAKATAPMLMGNAVATMNMITKPRIVAICGVMRPPRHLIRVQHGWPPATQGSHLVRRRAADRNKGQLPGGCLRHARIAAPGVTSCRALARGVDPLHHALRAVEVLHRSRFAARHDVARHARQCAAWPQFEKHARRVRRPAPARRTSAPSARPVQPACPPPGPAW